MKDNFGLSAILERLSDYWFRFRYSIGMGPPPWHRIETVDSIDFGDTVRVELRKCTCNPDRKNYLIDLQHEAFNNDTIALFHSCDLDGIVRVLKECQLAIKQHQNSLS